MSNSINGKNNIEVQVNNDDESGDDGDGDGSSTQLKILTNSNASSTSDSSYVNEAFESTASESSTDDMATLFERRLGDNYDNEIETLSDEISDLLARGSFYGCGFYQVLSFVVISIAWTLGTGWYAYVSVFTGYTPSHTCDFMAMQALLGPDVNLTKDSNDEQCSVTDRRHNASLTCTKWKFDENSQMKTTMITEQSLVCERNSYFEMAYSIEQSGYIIGTLLFSYFSDRVGRKPVLVCVLFVMSFLGLIQTFVGNFYLFFALGFLINSLACGVDATCIPLVIELFSTTKRTFFGIGIEVIWVIILATLAPLAYFIRMWREIRLAIFVVLSIFAILSIWFTQESTRWLISTNKLDKLKLIINRVASYNRLDRSNKQYVVEREVIEQKLIKLAHFNAMNHSQKLGITNDTNGEMATIESNSLGKKQESMTTVDTLATAGTIMSNETCKTQLLGNQPTRGHAYKREDKISDMFKNSTFRLYVFIMAFNWFATGLVYDGLIYLNNFIGENIFFNWIVMNLIELPAQFVCYVLISKYGRRFTVCVTLICAGCVLLLTCLDLVISFESLYYQRTKMILFIVAKFSITQSYSAIILHAPELFPTNLRSFGYGICLFSGKLTACLSLLISLYLGKVFPILPSIIYGAISILSGFLSLCVPETLNRPLPNSIDDVIKWPRSLTKDERSAVKKLNKDQFNIKAFVLKFKNSCNTSQSKV